MFFFTGGSAVGLLVRDTLLLSCRQSVYESIAASPKRAAWGRVQPNDRLRSVVVGNCAFQEEMLEYAPFANWKEVRKV